MSRYTFFYSSIFTKLVSTLTGSFKAVLQTLLLAESTFIPCYAVKKLQNKLCITGGRGSNQDIYLFLDSENCSNLTLIQLI